MDTITKETAEQQLQDIEHHILSGGASIYWRGIYIEWKPCPLKRGGILKRRGVYGKITYLYGEEFLTRDGAINKAMNPIVLSDKDRKLIETICADTCIRLNPDNPLALASSWSEMLHAIKYTEGFIKDLDALMKEPPSFERGKKLARLRNSLWVTIAMTLNKVTGQPLDKDLNKDSIGGLSDEELDSFKRFKLWQATNHFIKGE
jgi:hypothetical protein